MKITQGRRVLRHKWIITSMTTCQGYRFCMTLPYYDFMMEEATMQTIWEKEYEKMNLDPEFNGCCVQQITVFIYRSFQGEKPDPHKFQEFEDCFPIQNYGK